MAFDGVRHLPLLITPYHYHPEAPATGRVLAGSLANAYAYARWHSRLIGQQASMFLNGESNRRDRDNDFNWVAHSDYVSVARFRRRLPAHATHVLANVTGLIRQYPGGATIVTRIVVTDGTNTDTGVGIETPFNQQDPSEIRRLAAWKHGEPYIANAFTELRNVVLPARCTITVQSYAVDPEDVSEPGGSIYPEVVSAWFEVVG